MRISAGHGEFQDFYGWYALVVMETALDLLAVFFGLVVCVCFVLWGGRVHSGLGNKYRVLEPLVIQTSLSFVCRGSPAVSLLA